ncbi:sugar nucleotide-binding protein [Streptomyces longhuiensis]|uniref:sugar nucleotide-binding protein n=1 Tax=Streptomyces longhuiensis TaxID=2880933 RepID=UPI002222AA76|nr:sugar nucleotide-binding protein [Streptomyces longhuiensis]
MVYVSSDAVFSGAGQVHYDESALPETITPYSVAKAAAETEVFAVHPKAVVARTSLIIGHGSEELQGEVKGTTGAATSVEQPLSTSAPVTYRFNRIGSQRKQRLGPAFSCRRFRGDRARNGCPRGGTPGSLRRNTAGGSPPSPR